MAFHGVQVLYESITPPSVRTVDASTILCLGTAPGAATDGIFGQNSAIRYNHPFLLTQRTDAPEAALGATGTLPAALDSIFAQGNFRVVMVIVEAGAARVAKVAAELAAVQYNDDLTAANADWEAAEIGGNPYLVFESGIIAADETILTAMQVGDSINVQPDGGGTPIQTWTIAAAYDTTNDRIQLAPGSVITGFTDTTDYEIHIPAVAADMGEAQTRTNAIGQSSELTGIYAAHAATSVLGRNSLPRLICAPGIDTGSRPGGAGNPLAAAMVVVAENIKAMAFIDGPNTTHADVITYIGDFDSPRAVVLDPAVLVSDADGNLTEQALSGFAAGVVARNDYDNGWWTSFSNKPIRGIVGLARPIDAGHPNSRAQLMLDNKIFTVVNDVGGYQLWGTDTPATTEPDYSFPNVQRTADIMGDSIQRAHRWAVAKGITKNYLSAVSQSVNDFIRTLVARDALTGGRAYPDSALNTPANIALGMAYFNVEFTPVYPANSVIFKMQLTTKYLETLAA